MTEDSAHQTGTEAAAQAQAAPGSGPAQADDRPAPAPAGARNAPLDAIFEPAPAIERPIPPMPKASSPGWGGTIALSLVAALLGAGGGAAILSAGAIPGTALHQQLGELRASGEKSAKSLAALEQKLLGQSSSALALRNDLNRLNGDLQALSQRVGLFEARMDGVEKAGANPEGATYFEIARAIGSMRARIGALEAQAATLAAISGARREPGTIGIASAEGATAGAVLSQLAAMDGVLRQHETVLAGIRGPLASQADLAAAQEEVARLDKKFDDFEHGPAGPQRAAALYLVSAVQAAGDHGRAFEPEYSRLSQVLPKDEDVAALAGLARSGAPTLRDLQSDFPKAEHAALKAWNKARPSKGFFGWLDRLFAVFVTVRRVGPGHEDSAPAILSRAGRQLAEDDLASALGEMRRLKGPAAAAAGEWMAKAGARAELDRHLIMLRERLARDAAAL